MILRGVDNFVSPDKIPGVNMEYGSSICKIKAFRKWYPALAPKRTEPIIPYVLHAISRI
jgi:hypothetical protein